MLYQDYFTEIQNWVDQNILPLISAIITIVISYSIYYLIKKQINHLKQKGIIDDSSAKSAKTLIRILLYTIVIVAISIQFAETVGYMAGLITVAGGTVLGFAGINTLGNLIAGLIIMASKPFKVGDRIKFQNRVADVIDIKLVYTVLEDVDGVRISLPNQTLLKHEIENYGQTKILRRNVKITADYGVDPRLVEKALLDAAEKFQNILKYPEPRVDMYNFLDYAIEYRLIVFINDSKIIPKFDWDLKKAVYFSCRDYEIDLSMPLLMRKLSQEQDNLMPRPKSKEGASVPPPSEL